jgi:hypothetical protein
MALRGYHENAMNQLVLEIIACPVAIVQSEPRADQHRSCELGALRVVPVTSHCLGVLDADGKSGGVSLLERLVFLVEQFGFLHAGNAHAS